MTDAELIKSKIDIVEFLSEYVTLKKAGRNFKALCPFHSEKTPSFIVSPERGSWHCFGACSQGGDVISFLQKWENIDFPEALKILAKRTGVTLSHFVSTEEGKLKEKLYEINHLASEFYHYLLTNHKLGSRALEYLFSRGIKKETIKTFTLGYAPHSWESLLNFLTKKGYRPPDVYTAGLLVKSERGTYYDRFRGRLMFPLADHRGNIVGFSGRKIPSDSSMSASIDKEGKYINTSETPIYIKGNTLYGLDVTKEAIKREKEAVLVEGEFDFLSSFQTGVSNVVAIKGSALTEGQALLLKRYSENFIMALDSDLAGNQAARRGIEIAEASGASVRVVKLPVGKDPAECIEKDPNLWKKAVKEAVPVYDFIIENAFTKYKDEGVVGKKKVGDEVIPFLSKIKNPIIFSHYLKYLAKKLEVSEESIETATRQFQKKGELRKLIQVAPSRKLRNTLLEEHLLSLIVQNENPPQSLSVVFETLGLEDFDQPPVRMIIEKLTLYFKRHKKFKVKDFGKLLTPEIAPVFDRAFLVDIDNILSQKNIYNKELISTVKEVKRLSLRRRIESLSTKIQQKEDREEEGKVEELREQLRQLLIEVRKLDKSLK